MGRKERYIVSRVATEAGEWSRPCGVERDRCGVAWRSYVVDELLNMGVELLNFGEDLLLVPAPECQVCRYVVNDFDYHGDGCCYNPAISRFLRWHYNVDIPSTKDFAVGDKFAMNDIG